MITIEYFYSAHSAFAYIGSLKLYELCERYNCHLIHRPIALSPVVEASGAIPFDQRNSRHEDYYFGREIQRWAQYRQVPVMNRRPTHHDNSLNLANGMLISAIEQGANINALAHAVLKAHWVSDIDLNDADSLRLAATSVGIDATPFLDNAMSEEVQKTLLNNAFEAIERGLFGSPTYVVNGDMYYGQDHLELIEHSFMHPFTNVTFKNNT